MITEYAGRVRFENVEEGVTVTRQTDEITGLSTLVVIDGKRRTSTSKLLRPTVKLLDENGEEVTVPGTETPVSMAFPVGAVITVREDQEVGKGDVLAHIPQASSKTRDITGGLPRVAELFEARVPKDAGMLAEVTGTVSFGKETKRQTTLGDYRFGRCGTRNPDFQRETDSGARRPSSEPWRNYRRRLG